LIDRIGDSVILPKAPVERLIRSSGAQRVSDEASRELAEVLERVGQKISEQAKKYAIHAGRKTIVADDIKLASQNFISEI
jgi:histone H3/H4